MGGQKWQAHQAKLADQLAHLSAQDPVDYALDGQFDVNYVVSLDKFHTIMEISDDAGQTFRQHKVRQLPLSSSSFGAIIL